MMPLDGQSYLVAFPPTIERNPHVVLVTYVGDVASERRISWETLEFEM